MKRVTVTLPDELVKEIDRWDSNRSRFVLEAAYRELSARRRRELECSLANPHQESSQIAEAGIEEWGRNWAADEDLLDESVGQEIRWTDGRGWHEAE